MTLNMWRRGKKNIMTISFLTAGVINNFLLISGPFWFLLGCMKALN